MGDLFEKAARGRVSLLSSNICETQQQQKKQRTEKGGKKFTSAPSKTKTRTKTHLRWQMEVALLQKREGDGALVDGSEEGIISRRRETLCWSKCLTRDATAPKQHIQKGRKEGRRQESVVASPCHQRHHQPTLAPAPSATPPPLWAWQQGDSAPAAQQSVSWCQRVAHEGSRCGPQLVCLCLHPRLFPPSQRLISAIYRKLAAKVGEKKGGRTARAFLWQIEPLYRLFFFLESWCTLASRHISQGTCENEPRSLVSGRKGWRGEQQLPLPASEHLMEQMCFNCNQ